MKYSFTKHRDSWNHYSLIEFISNLMCSFFFRNFSLRTSRCVINELAKLSLKTAWFALPRSSSALVFPRFFPRERGVR